MAEAQPSMPPHDATSELPVSPTNTSTPAHAATAIPSPAPELPADVLARAHASPTKPPFPTAGLTGPRRVHLRLLHADSDSEPLWRLTNGSAQPEQGIPAAYDCDALVWRFIPMGPFDTPQQLRSALQALADTPNLTALCVCDVSAAAAAHAHVDTRGQQGDVSAAAEEGHGLSSQGAGVPVGVTCLMSNQPRHLCVELGGIWYSPAVQRLNVNTEAVLLMLRHCFGTLGYRRVEWKCDTLNIRSAAAAVKLGFRPEGVFRQHMIVKGRSRDTAWFSMLDTERPQVEQRLVALLR